MSKLPRVSSREVIRALQRIGFVIDRQRGSHVILVRDTPAATTVVPQRRELPAGTLRAIIRDTGMTVEDFVALL